MCPLLLDEEFYTPYFLFVDDGGRVAEAFYDANLIARVELLDNPFAYILRSRVEVENLVEVGMVHLAVYGLLDVREIFHHAVFVQPIPADEENFYLPVVPMHVAALALVAELERVGCRYF